MYGVVVLEIALTATGIYWTPFSANAEDHSTYVLSLAKCGFFKSS